MTDPSDTIDPERATDERAPREYVFRHDMSGDRPLAVSIATAVGDATGTDPLRLPPLGRVVDLDFDALDTLFTPAGTDSANVRDDDDNGTEGDGTDGDASANPAGSERGRPRAAVRFLYDGHEVVVHGDGRIRVRDAG